MADQNSFSGICLFVGVAELAVGGTAEPLLPVAVKVAPVAAQTAQLVAPHLVDWLQLPARWRARQPSPGGAAVWLVASQYSAAARHTLWLLEWPH